MVSLFVSLFWFSVKVNILFFHSKCYFLPVKIEKKYQITKEM